MNDEAHDSGRHDDERLGELFESADDDPGRERDQDGTDVGACQSAWARETIVCAAKRAVGSA